MYRAAIIYAPGEARMLDIVGRLEDCLQRQSFEVICKEAGQAHMPDLTAADLFLLGSLPEAKGAIHADFSEMVRAFEGITLAGRVAGCFSVDSEATLKAFGEVLKDSELSLGNNNYLNIPDAESGRADLQGWIAALVEQLKDIKGGR
jgi:flavodoxin